MRFRARTAATLLALASAACLAPAAGAAEPRATKLEKVSSFVQPGVVYLTTVYSGRVEGRFVQTAGECTGFFVNPDGHFVTAGHCVDRADGRDLLIETALTELNGGVAPDPLTLQLALDTWKVRSARTPGRSGPDRDVEAAYGVNYGGLPTGRPLPARVQGLRAFGKGDVALAKIEAEDVPVLELAPPGSTEVGTKVVSVGYPGSVKLVTDQTFDPSFKEGSISSRRTIEDGLVPVLEVSSALSPGMSGGPTVDLQGRVVGVNSFFPAGEPQPFNFISPVSEVEQLLADEGVENELGRTNTLYREGLAAYYAGERDTAVARFDEVLGQIREHQFAQEFRAKALRLPEEDDGGFPTALLVLLIALGIAAAGAAAWLYRRRAGGAAEIGRRAAAGGPSGAGAGALVVTSGARQGERFEIAGEQVIGRDADIALEDGEVSRRHASVKSIAEGLVLTDLGSSNGTLVNGERLDRPALLADGDLISVGDTRLTVDSPAARAVGRTRMRKADAGLTVATLVVNEGPLAGERFPIGGELFVGRAGADITVHDPEVSRRHVRVRPMNGGLEVTDLGSANGTAVNGVRIDTPTAVSDGDVIQVGQTSITVVGANGAARPGPTVKKRVEETKQRP